MIISTNVEFLPGTHISTACKELIDLANRIGHKILADFNEVTLMAKPGDSPILLEKNYKLESNSKKTCKMARGNKN
jgi:hypothetical protein